MSDLVVFVAGYVVTRELIRRGSFLGPIVGLAGVCYLVARAAQDYPTDIRSALRLVGRGPGQDMRPVVFEDWHA